MPEGGVPRPSTFSIVAHDPATGEWGVGVASKFLAVGAVVPWAQAGAGALAYGGYLDRYVDLRVDDHPAPIGELTKLLELHRLYFGATDKAHLIRMSGNVVTMVQEILNRTGHYAGPVDGAYDSSTRDALRRWCGVENFEERWRDDDLVDREILSYMRRRHGS